MLARSCGCMQEFQVFKVAPTLFRSRDTHRGNSHELGSGRRQLKSRQGEGEGEVGSAHGRRPHAAAGRRDLLVGKRVERYGYAKEQAEQELDELARSLAAGQGP